MDSEADVAAVAAVRHALEVAENAADADTATALLTEDAVLMVPDFPVQEGKAACAVFLRDIMGAQAAYFDRHISYVSAEVVVIGDLAFDRGTFSFTVAPKEEGTSSEVTGKYLWLLRRSGEAAWRVARAIMCRDDPPEEGSPDPVV